MTEEPRVFEADALVLSKFELIDRPSNDTGKPHGGLKDAALKRPQSVLKTQALSREVILRLIAWFQKE